MVVLGLVFALGGAARAGTISLDDPLVPAGLGDGDTFHLVFVTTTTRDASPTDIAVYNAFVQAAADGGGSVVAGHGFTWKAIGSTETTNARDNAVVSAPVYRLDGVQVATGYADMWSGTIAHPINKDQTGATRNVEVWTGSTTGGLTEYCDYSEYGPEYANYPAYLGGAADNVRTGLSYASSEPYSVPAETVNPDTAWINWDVWYTPRYMADSYSLYALSEELEVEGGGAIVPEPASLGLVGLALLAVRRRRS